MSDYVKTTNFAAKDSLPSGNAGKIVKGTEINTEFDNIATAVATKENAANKGAASGYVGFDSSYNISAAGSITGASFIPNSSTVPTNGVYLPASNTVGIASNTTLRASVNSAGNWSFAAPSSGVGITSTAPSGSSFAYRATSQSGSGNYGGMSFFASGAREYGIFALTTDGGLYFQDVTANASRAILGSSGNWQINAPTSGAALTVNGVSGARGIDIFEAGLPNLSFSTAGGLRSYIQYSEAGTKLTIDSDGILALDSNNTERMTIASAGNVSINAPASGNTLSVAPLAGNAAIDVQGVLGSGTFLNMNNTSGTDGRAVIAFQATMGSTKQYTIGIDASGGSTKSFDIRDVTNGRVPFSISTTGNTSIAAPSSGNSVISSSLSGSLAYQATATTGAAGHLGIGWSAGISSNEWNVYTSSTDPLTIGTQGSATLKLATNNTARVTIAAASGAVTFTGGLSGITTLAMTGALSGATTGAFSAGLTCTTLGMGGALTGATTGSFSGAVATGDLSVTGTISKNGTLINDSGSFTGTLTGCTTSPTGTIEWSRSGTLVTLHFPAITGTSNTVAASITGLPAGLTPSVSRSSLLARVMDNSTIALGLVTIGNTGTIGMGPEVTGAANFTSSGTKGIQSCAVTYSL